MAAMTLAWTKDESARDWLAYGALLAVGGVLYVLCRLFPADLPFWMPWEFSWPAYLATTLSLAWFFRGIARLPASERPAVWRNAAFVIGVAADYAVLQTHVDYLAQHMFFVHRWAHFILHHTGAFLIALGASGPAVRAGMPDFLKPLIDARPVQRMVDFMQHPAVAPFLFVGLLYFWLFPEVHTRVMLDRNLYDIMNWTMAINGIFFWCLILDQRPKPPARLSSLMRALLIIAIELPQMVLGAILSLSMTDYYPVYNICGRVFDMTALNDQHYGGLIIWLPGTMMSFAAMICVLVVMRINEERAEKERFFSPSP
ncbi:MAG: cytochrome c oxidase assembly protein [Alphaproteobacteria bacterium]|nr:cytochrome c oxidase assembly protein [Alphaproteobacteria bacterium]MDE2631109.1 cytochrome c oxidase assembly protein [Alphaproteobacteria bacterium]